MMNMIKQEKEIVIKRQKINQRKSLTIKQKTKKESDNNIWHFPTKLNKRNIKTSKKLKTNRDRNQKIAKVKGEIVS